MLAIAAVPSCLRPYGVCQRDLPPAAEHAQRVGSVLQVGSQSALVLAFLVPTRPTQKRQAPDCHLMPTWTTQFDIVDLIALLNSYAGAIGLAQIGCDLSQTLA